MNHSARSGEGRTVEAAVQPYARPPAPEALSVREFGGSAYRTLPDAPPQAELSELMAAAAELPLAQIQLERAGVRGRLIKELAKLLDLPNTRLFAMLGVPKATAERIAANDGVISGGGGQAVISLARLLAQAQRIVADSTAEAAAEFNVGHWLGRWLERPHPALGGYKPGDLLDTPTGQQLVRRTLGALESGVYL